MSQSLSSCRSDRMLDSSVTSIVNICQGFVLVTLNAAIVAVVLFQRLIREQKEYVLIAGLAAADVTTGIAVFTSGCWRAIWFIQGRAEERSTKWACFWSPWIVTFNWSVPASSYMLLVVSVDRYIAVFRPLTYFTLTSRYAFRVIMGLATFASAHFGVSAALSYYSNSLERSYSLSYFSNCTKYCVSSRDGEASVYSDYLIGARIMAPLLSIVIYSVNALRIRKHINGVRGISGAETARKLKRLHLFTITHTISGLFTFIFHTTPLILSFLILPPIVNDHSTRPVFPFVALTLANFNPMFNSFIYFLRHVEIRDGLKLMLKGKQLKNHSPHHHVNAPMFVRRNAIK